MSVGIGKIQFHYFSFEVKKVSDKIKKLENTLIIYSSDIMMTSFIVKEESETIRHFKLIQCTPFYLKPAEIEATVIEKLICA